MFRGSQPPPPPSGSNIQHDPDTHNILLIMALLVIAGCTLAVSYKLLEAFMCPKETPVWPSSERSDRGHSSDPFP